MNQKNAITSMIPRRLLEYVPLQKRGSWADQIVSIFKENNPALYAEIGRWREVPEEEMESVLIEIIAAAGQIRQDIIDES